MLYSDIPLFSAMRQKMQYLSERQALLAQNIANADTPGYAPHDLVKPDFGAIVQQQAGQLGLARTDPKHLGGDAPAGPFKVITREQTYETNPNENKVALDEEVQKLSMNQMDYQQVAAMYRKTVDMFKTAIGRSGGS